MTQKKYFTVISAVYNVSEYLDDYLNSLEQQTYSPEQIILVNDGSTDNSLDILKAWAAEKPHVLVLTKENGGQASARNLGIKHATSEWLNFADPDDVLDKNFFYEAKQFIEENPKVEFLAGNIVTFTDNPEKPLDNHPLRKKFEKGNRLVDLEIEPNYFQMFVNASFVRSKIVNDVEIRFDELLKPHFEDGLFNTQYLLNLDIPLAGFLQSAKYLYRRRVDGSSSIQTAADDVRRFTTILERGYLTALKYAEAKKYRIPFWLQNMIIYELNWFLRDDEVMFGSKNAADHGVGNEYNALVREIIKYLDPEVIESFDILDLPPSRMQVLNYGYRGKDWHSESLIQSDIDPIKREIKFIYRFSGNPPVEEIFYDGKHILPNHHKTRSLTYAGEVMLWERIIWLPGDGVITVRLNGKPVPLNGTWRKRNRYVLVGSNYFSSDLTDDLEERRPKRIDIFSNSLEYISNRLKKQKKRFTIPRIKAKLFRIGIKQRSLYKGPADVWMFMDRDADANDNAEHLFRYIRNNYPEINAWFTLRKDSIHWSRLEKEFPGKVVAYGSVMWAQLAMASKFIISSHADGYVYAPTSLRNAGKLKWKFIFLQHGVIIHDLSRWLNSKPISLMITSARKEYESIVANQTNYRMTTKEVALTGLPRHDRLLKLNTEVTRKKRILIAPTWRQWLVGERKHEGGERESIENFVNTDYALNWQKLFNSKALQKISEEHNLEITVLLHPNMANYAERFNYSLGVKIATYQEDVQYLFASTRILITDYSSIAFETAYSNAATVYYQFDKKLVFGGGHTIKQGYFDYEKNGFGPVVEKSSSVISNVERLLSDQDFENKYIERAENFFKYKDGNSSKRVFQAILELESSTE